MVAERSEVSRSPDEPQWVRVEELVQDRSAPSLKSSRFSKNQLKDIAGVRLTK